MAAQVGVAGSAHIGEQCIVAGQSGIVGHITLGDHVTVAAQSGVTRSVPAGQAVFGSPAMEASKRRKMEVLMRNMEGFVERLKKLEKNETR